MHLVTGKIQQYLPSPRDVFTQGILQARYYLVGIFRGDPHPFARGPGNKLNVLQQVTYLMILNLLLPTQVITGALLWEAKHFSTFIDTIGGLATLSVIHVAAAWLFIAFIVMHVYLTTTGDTPLSHLRAMLTGYETHREERALKGTTHEPSETKRQ
jgi:thiosulfate reductase cytochrome b subunit